MTTNVRVQSKSVVGTALQKCTDQSRLTELDVAVFILRELESKANKVSQEPLQYGSDCSLVCKLVA